MFLPFFKNLRDGGVPVSLREFLSFLEGMSAGLVTYDLDGFYYLSRAAMVKDERHLDRFDRAFAASFDGVEAITVEQVMEALDLPEDWLRKMAEKHLSPEEMAEIEALGGFDKLMETLKERLKEQEGRHQGGNKWIGTAGTSPFANAAYTPSTASLLPMLPPVVSCGVPPSHAPDRWATPLRDRGRLHSGDTTTIPDAGSPSSHGAPAPQDSVYPVRNRVR